MCPRACFFQPIIFGDEAFIVMFRSSRVPDAESIEVYLNNLNEGCGVNDTTLEECTKMHFIYQIT